MQQTLIEALQRGDYDTAAAAARELIQAEPENADAYHLYGLARHGLGDLDGASASLDQAIALAPDRASYHLSRAQVSLARREIDQARGELEAAVRLDPNQLGAYVLLSNLALSRRDLEDAERQARLALRVNPEHPHALAALGNFEAARGNHEEAVKVLDLAAKRAPEDGMVLAALGLAYQAAGHHAFAEQALRRAIALQPRVTGLRWSLVEALRAQGRLVDALADIEALLAANPGDPRARGTRGEILMRKGQLDDALAEFRTLLEEYPRHTVALDAALAVHRQRDDRQGARDLVEDLLARDPLAEHLWQTRLNLEIGDAAAMEQTLARWLAAVPQSPVVHELKARMAEARGDTAGARDWTDRGLGLAANYLPLHMLRIRLDLDADPAAVLARVGDLLPQVEPAVARGQLLAWRGLALDRLDRTAEAAESWLAMRALPLPGAPLPASLPAGQPVPADGGPSPRLIWSAPGAAGERLVTLLRGHPECVLADDRLGSAQRADGLGPGRADDGEDAKVLPMWRHLLARAGIEAHRVVEWLPHWDARMQSSLPGSRLLVILRDPREMLLNWLVYGSPQGYRFPGVEAAADWMAQALAPLLERLQAGDTSVRLLRGEAIDADPAAAAAELAEHFGLETAPGTSHYPQTGIGLGGHPNHFPAGHWRRFSEGPLADAFARLGPTAQALGY